MPKILIATDNLPDQINGVVTTYNNIELMAARDGYSIEYIHPGLFNYYRTPKYEEVKLVLYPKNIDKIIEHSQADYFHIATEGPIGFWVRSYLTKNKIKYNTAYHTKFPEGLNKLLYIPESITWKYIRWFHKHTGRVLTTTNSMAAQLKEKGFTSEVISWTRGVNREIFYPNRTKPNDKLTLVCVSRVSKEKSLEDFFKLQYPNVRKIMVGDGPMRKQYEEKYPSVEFVGFKTGSDLAYYYNLADVFVFPSRWETFGIVMIEAMACGTPVAAYPCQGPIDVVDQNVTGFMDDNLTVAIDHCLDLNRDSVYKGSMRWTWDSAWEIFKKNLVG